MQTAIMDDFPISFTVTDLWHRLTDCIKTLFYGLLYDFL